MRHALSWAALALLVGAACSFAPDLSRFDACDEQRPCAPGYTCLPDVGRCLPDCGANESCVPPEEDGGTDAGETADAGGDAGTLDAGQTDAGPPLILSPIGLERATEEFPYTHTFQASGGTAPYGFAALAPLPPGLSLGDGGTLSGTPEAAGNFLLRIQVMDQGTPPKQDQRDYPLFIRQRLRVAGPETLALVPIDQSYQEGIQATGGLPPYTFTLAAGNLPPGLSLASDGGVSGMTPDFPASSFDVQVTDSDTPPQTASGRLNLATTDCSFCVRTRGLPEGRVGTPYAYTLQSSGGTPPIRWSVQEGSLPAGLSLSTEGVLSGTPTQPTPVSGVQLTLAATYSTILGPVSDQVVVRLRVR
jgi:hypothetical protein